MNPPSPLFSIPHKRNCDRRYWRRTADTAGTPDGNALAAENCSLDTELIRRKFKFEQYFRIRHLSDEVYGSFCFHMFENSAIQRTDTCEDWMIGLLEVPYHLCYYGNFIFLLVGDLSLHTISLHLHDPQKSNDLSETFARTILLALSPKYNFVHYFFLSNRCRFEHGHEDDCVKKLFWCRIFILDLS